MTPTGGSSSGQGDSALEAEGAKSRSQGPWNLLRRIASIALLAATAAAVILTYTDRQLWACRQQMTPNGSVVDVCGPVGTNDLVLIGIVVLLALLIYPDLTEISITGLGSIKRAITEQTTATKELGNQVQILTKVSQSQVFSPVVKVDFAGLGKTAGEKTERIETGEAPVVVDAQPLEPRVDPERAQGIRRLLELATEVSRNVSLAHMSTLEANELAAHEGVEPSVNAVRIVALRSWASTFRDEIQGMLTAQATLLSNSDGLSDKQLADAIVLGEHLLDGVQASLDRGVFGNEEARLIEEFHRWLEGQGWSVTVRPDINGWRPDLVGTLEEKKLLAEIEVGDLGAARWQRLCHRLSEIAEDARADQLAVVVPSSQAPAIRERLREASRTELPMRTFEVGDDGAVGEITL